MRIFFIIMTFLLLSACNDNQTNLEGSLVYCTESRPESFNPQISHDVSSLDATTHQLYNRLLKIDPITKAIIPDLATHWEEDTANNSFTFHLRRHVEFHTTDYFSPTQYFSADDVIYSFNRMLSTKHPFHAINRLSDNYFFNHPFTNTIKEIVKIDDYTVKFMLKKKDDGFLNRLTAHFAVILSKQYAIQLLSKGTPDKIDYFPIGTGPYKFKNTYQSKLIRYQANDKYWQGKPNIDNLIFDVTPTSIKRYAKLLSGQCDVITYPSPDQIEQIAKNKEYALNIQPTSNIILLAVNSKRPALTNSKTRKALLALINKEQIIQSIFFNTATVTNSLLSRQSWAFNPRLTHEPIRDKVAKKELELLNYPFSKPLTILVPVKGAVFNPNFSKTAEIIKHNLSNVGVQSHILALSRIELNKYLNTGNYDLLLTGLNVHIDDPINLFRPLLSCDSTAIDGNSAQWCEQETQQILETTPNGTRLREKMKQYYNLQAIIQSQSIYLPIAHILRFEAMTKNISGITVNPLTGINFTHAIKQGGL